jgi:hypothetical protein
MRQLTITAAPTAAGTSTPSDGEDDPAEWTVLDKVAQSVGRLGQRERLSHYRLDSAGLKQRDDGIPRFLPGRWRLSQQRELFIVARFQIRSVTSMAALRPAE